jgi:hypothetical protein
MIASTASVPTLGVSPSGGAALTFSNAVAPTFLYSHLRNGGDPGVSGMTLAVCFTLTGVPTGAAKHYVASRGLRPVTGGLARGAGVPAYEQGWALYAASVNGTTRLFFDVSSFNPADSAASVSVPLAAGVAAVVLVTVFPDPATAGNAQLESRRFLVNATLNGAPFDDAANGDYTGIVMANEGVDLVVGAREDGAVDTGFAGQLREISLFSRPLPLAEGAALSAYYAARHGAGVLACPALTGLPYVVPTSAACAAPTEGGVCTTACAAGAMLVAGAQSTTCAGGVWGGRLPVCAPACNV